MDPAKKKKKKKQGKTKPFCVFLPFLHSCMGGLGRACVIASCLLQYFDNSVTPDQTIFLLRDLRGACAVQTVKVSCIYLRFLNGLRGTLPWSCPAVHCSYFKILCWFNYLLHCCIWFENLIILCIKRAPKLWKNKKYRKGNIYLKFCVVRQL